MAIRLVNSAIWNRPVSRPRLGAPEASVLSFNPDSVPPERVPPMPVSDDDAAKARKTYALVAGTLEGEVEWLGRLRPANWDETALEVIAYSKTQYDSLVREVRGRTGNPDAEYELELQWWGLWSRAYQAYQNPPSWLSQASDKVSVFMTDFVNGAKVAWQSYSEWAIKNSGPVLRKYHDCLSHVAMLKAEFGGAQASGAYSSGKLFDQEQAITRAEDALNTVRTTYRAMSAGGDIDKAAVEVYGPPSLGAIQISAILAIKIVVISTVIAVAAITIFSVGKMGGTFVDGAKQAVDSVTNLAKDNPVGFILSVGCVAAMIALPFVLFRNSAQAAPAAVPQAEAS